MAGTRQIVTKYTKLIHEAQPESDSSDEPFQFSVPDDKAEKLRRRQEKAKRMIAHRRRLTSREIISMHRSRYGGCGVFKRPNNVSEIAVGGTPNKPTTSDLIDGVESQEEQNLDEEELLNDSEYGDEMSGYPLKKRSQML